jgi:hypothetical protein
MRAIASELCLGVALWLPPERPAYPFNLLCRLITVSLETMRIVRASLLDILDPSR